MLRKPKTPRAPPLRSQINDPGGFLGLGRITRQQAAVPQMMESISKRLRTLISPTEEAANAFVPSKAAMTCVDSAVTICDPSKVINVESMYSVLRMFGGGKSGAYLFLVLLEKEDPSIFSNFQAMLARTYAPKSEKAVLKCYPDTFDKDNHVLNERPLREISALCIMSGTQGFPTLISKGCTAFPKTWVRRFSGTVHVRLGESIPEAEYEVPCPYAVMSIAPGVPLTALDLHKLTSDQLVAILIQLLHLLKEAKEKLGPDFEHFDLHPDNIFVDAEHCQTIPIREHGFSVTCPVVNIIDFDLVNSAVFRYNPAFSKGALEEHIKKRTGLAPVPERTFAFASKWLGEKVFSVLNSLKDIKNTDIRNWMVLLHVIANVLDYKGIVPCSTPDQCIDTNFAFFNQYLSGVSGMTAPTPVAVETQENLLKRVFGDKFTQSSIVGLVLGKENTRKSMLAISELDRRLRKKQGYHISPDDLAVVIRSEASGDFNVAIGFNLPRELDSREVNPIETRASVTISGRMVETTFTLEHSSDPHIDITFTPALAISGHAWAIWELVTIFLVSIIYNQSFATALLNRFRDIDVRMATTADEWGDAKRFAAGYQGFMKYLVSFLSAFTTITINIENIKIGIKRPKVIGVSIQVNMESSIVARLFSELFSYITSFSTFAKYTLFEKVPGKTGTYIIRIEVGASDEANPCVELWSASAETEDQLHTACNKYLMGLVMLVWKFGDPVIHATNDFGRINGMTTVLIQARDPKTHKVLEEVPFSLNLKFSDLPIEKFLEIAKAGKMTPLQFLTYVGGSQNPMTFLPPAARLLGNSGISFLSAPIESGLNVLEVESPTVADLASKAFAGDIVGIAKSLAVEGAKTFHPEFVKNVETTLKRAKGKKRAATTKPSGLMDLF